MSFICGECGYLIDKPERPYWMLSEYLVPILRKDEIEDGAECLLQQHLSGAYQNPREHYAEALAQKMGLTVVRYPLHLRSRTRKNIIFSAAYLGDVQFAIEYAEAAQHKIQKEEIDGLPQILAHWDREIAKARVELARKGSGDKGLIEERIRIYKQYRELAPRNAEEE